MKKTIAIDAFCGAGGLSLGLTRAGFDLKMAFDLDEEAIQTYNQNLTDKAHCKNIKDLTGKSVLELAGINKDELTLIAGGPPCQGFSIQRRGSDQDDRNDLVFDYFRIIGELEPTFFVMENVAGIKGSRGKKYMAYISECAEKYGYKLHIKTLDAADFGVAQHRKRVFIVGEKPLNGVTCFHFPEPTYNKQNKRTVREALEGLPEPPDDYSEHQSWPNHRKERLSEINKLRISFVPQGGGREHIPDELQLACHRNSSPNSIGHRYVYGRLHGDEPAGTITARFDSFTRGKFAHPYQDRTITLREGARLQSFPDSFIFTGTKVSVARQIGNAVPPLLAEAVGRAIIEANTTRETMVNIDAHENLKYAIS